MQLDPSLFAVLLALGAIVGLVAGLLGVGGGGIMVPMLTSIFLWRGLAPEVSVHLALGTSMAAIVVTALSSARAHHRRAGVLWRVVMLMVPGIVLGTYLATALVARLDGRILALIFAMFMAGVALQMLLGAQPKPTRSLPSGPWISAVGSGIGAISALVSIGGGTMSVPFLYWNNVPLKTAIGTSAGIGVPIAIFGTLGYVIHGSDLSTQVPHAIGFIHWPAVLMISVASAAFAPIGVRLAYRMPVPRLKKIFAFLLLALSAKMLHAMWL